MDTYSTEMLNDMFSQNVEDPNERVKIADSFGSYLRDKMREVSFADKLVPPVQVSRDELTRSTQHDTLVKIVDVEPKSRAMALTFRDTPTVNTLRGKRFAIPFMTLSSEKFEATEQELMASEAPITKIVEDNALRDVHEIKDREFLLHCESCVQQVQIDANGGAVVKLNGLNFLNGTCIGAGAVKGELAQTSPTQLSFTVLPIQRPDFAALNKTFINTFRTSTSPNAPVGRLRADRYLLGDSDFEDMMLWTIEEFGDKVQSEVVVDGYKYNQVMGRKYVRTIKTDILATGNIYAYAEPQYFGRSYVLNPVKFYIDKVANVITWQLWTDIGMGFAGISGVRKLELYAASVTPTTTDMGFETRGPADEEDLGAQNTRVDDGIWFPAVGNF